MTKKKASKKVSKKTNLKNAVVVGNESEVELQETALNNSAIAQLSNFDLSQFEGVELDVADNSTLFANDFVVPKIWLMQTMSDLAKSKEHEIEEGDYVDSRSEEVLLSYDGEYLPIVVLKTFKRWQTFKLVKGKKEFLSSEIMSLENAGLKYEDTIDGNDVVRRQVISAYVLLGDHVQKGMKKPYIVDFAATSKGAGRDLVSDINVLNARKLPSYVGWFKLGKAEDSNDEGDFFIKTCKFGGLLPETVFPFLKDCYMEIKSMIDANAIEIDDRDVRDSSKQNKNQNVVDEAGGANAKI